MGGKEYGNRGAPGGEVPVPLRDLDLVWTDVLVRRKEEENRYGVAVDRFISFVRGGEQPKKTSDRKETAAVTRTFYSQNYTTAFRFYVKTRAQRAHTYTN